MGFIDIKDLGTVHFHEYGTGKKPLLAFHGYGMTGKQFDVLEKSVLADYHVYGFDHFFHGGSVLNAWTEEQILAGIPKKYVREYAEEWFKIQGKQRFSVMGYSIGANLALILAEEYPELIDDIILMAPDGVSVYKGFDFLVYQPLGKFLFSRAVESKWLAPSMIKTLKRLGIIDESLFKIAYNEIDTPQKRLDVYYTLNIIRHLKADNNKVTGLINEYKIRCKLIFGEHDNLFPKRAAADFIAKLNDAEVHEPPMGHWLVTPALDEYLVNLPR